MAADAQVLESNKSLIEAWTYWARHSPRMAHLQPDHAEAVMRHAIQEAERVAGPKQAVLHATAAGKPVYQAMGFREVAPFTGYYASGG